MVVRRGLRSFDRLERAGYLRRVPDPHDRRSALALSDAGGHGRVARVGLASAIVGQFIIAAAEVISPSNRDLGDVLFSVSPILTGAGLVTAGVAIIRAGVWARPSRFAHLTLCSDRRMRAPQESTCFPALVPGLLCPIRELI